MLRKLYPNVYLFLRVEPLPVHGKPRFVRGSLELYESNFDDNYQ